MTDLKIGQRQALLAEIGIEPRCYKKPALQQRYFDYDLNDVVVSCYCEFEENGGGACLYRLLESEIVAKPKQGILSFMERNQ